MFRKWSKITNPLLSVLRETSEIKLSVRNYFLASKYLSGHSQFAHSSANTQLKLGNVWTRTLFRTYATSETEINSQSSSPATGTEASPSLTEEEIQELTKGDPEVLKKLKVLQFEHQVLLQDGEKVPTHIKTYQWEELLSKPSRSSRKKYYLFLFIKEKKREGDKLKKEERKRLFASRPPKEVSDHIQYGLAQNCILLKIYDSSMDAWENYKMFVSHRFGENLIYDMGFDENMTKRERLNAAQQLTLAFAENRSHKNPFFLHFCNVKREGDALQQLHKMIPTLYDPDFPIQVDQTSYLDHYQKEKLVYLTPHCREEMECYDHDKVYIIGGIVDKGVSEPLTLAKAKREGIHMQKLPLDRYLDWGAGSGKSLTLNQMLSILLELRTSGDWHKALANVPRRKVRSEPLPSPVDRMKIPYWKKQQANDSKSYGQSSYDRPRRFNGGKNWK